MDRTLQTAPELQVTSRSALLPAFLWQASQASQTSAKTETEKDSGTGDGMDKDAMN